MSKDPRRLGFYIPLTCEKHKEKTFVKDPYDFRTLDGGYARPCRELMACGHFCALNCHPFPHEIINCQKRCSRTLKCGHPCTQACYLECKPDCECIIVELATQPLDYAQAIKTLVTPPLGKENQVRYLRSSSPEKKNQAPQNPSPSRGVARETQLFRDFASGGHVESDKNLRALAERENAAARHRKLDTENLISFDDAMDEEVPAKNLDNVKLVRTKSNGQGGTRGAWKGTFDVPRSENASPKKQQEGSLLDL